MAASSSSVTNKSTGLIFVLVTMLIWIGAAGQPEYCNNAIMSLEPCLSYVTDNSESPSSSCCSSLASVVETQPECLCGLINGGSIPNIDRQRVLGLPATCNVQTPPANLCNGKNHVSFFNSCFFLLLFPAFQ
ncbi:hypothetical protein LguiA_030942 [Lonicera macranthoides]